MSEDVFRFRRFAVRNRDSALKVGTDAVLLGAAMRILPSDRRALDIGTGTGVIALMAAQRSEDFCRADIYGSAGLRISGIEIDPLSAAEAEFNFRHSPWSDRLEALCTPLSAYRPAEKFDLIFSNPPYYDCSLRNPDLRAAAARHNDSLSYREILAFAAEQLLPGGRLAIILPSEQSAGIRRCAASYGLLPLRVLGIRTAESKPLKRSIIEFSALPGEMQEDEITLMRDGARSEEYRRLTEDFYL